MKVGIFIKVMAVQIMLLLLTSETAYGNNPLGLTWVPDDMVENGFTALESGIEEEPERVVLSRGDVERYVRNTAGKYGLDPEIVLRMVYTESRFNQNIPPRSDRASSAYARYGKKAEGKRSVLSCAEP